MSNAYIKLAAIQGELKAPKNKWNDYGKYNYRSLEDICESVKPLLIKHKCALFLQDRPVQIGDRTYIEATASFVDLEAEGENAVIEVSAYAREDEAKKGMDGSQITGTASSYGRKYCLNGLFLIDDTKDADTNEYQQQTSSSPSKPKEKGVTDQQKRKLMDACKEKGMDINDMLKKVGCTGKMTKEQYEKALKLLEDKNE